MTNVKYSEFMADGQEKQHDYACFAQMYGGSWGVKYTPARIVYNTSVHASLQKKPDLIQFYLDFLQSVLNRELFSINYDTEKQKIVWELQTTNLPRIRALMYLTAFRYFDEFPGLLEKFYEAAKNLSPAEEKFRVFLETHFDNQGEFPTLGAHGLVRRRAVGRDKEYNVIYDKSPPITFEQFKKNIENPAIQTVHNFFLTTDSVVDSKEKK